ncbi:MAG: class I SAM-dependent methyltransferase [Deltaproteobacteria bacterium]|jgi:SAM-dependent methyltransferase|nr:class I SAM-dependent methyltransferase [Deltaproteobacteria bacterium]
MVSDSSSRTGESIPQKNKWPKVFEPLTPERQAIRDDFMGRHLEAVQKKWYGFVERFNHGYPLRTFQAGQKTLEIGAGIGAHLNWENYKAQEYHCNELREALCESVKQNYKGVEAKAGDCQQRLPYDDGYFDRVLAIHVLEHLPNLPAALKEIRRVLKDDGVFSVVIPCEGSLATRLARNISARPHFEKLYGQSYDWFIQSEHINLPGEIFEELEPFFQITHRRFYPTFLPILYINLFIGLTLKPK